MTGFTLFFWVTATWWIPLLIILGVWRHADRRFPFRYDPQYWGVFVSMLLSLAAAAKQRLTVPENA